MLLSRFVVVAALLFSISACGQCPKKADNCTVTVRPTDAGNGTITTATFDNRAHAEAVSRATSRITEAGLTYLLVTRPLEQTIRNEAVNRRDGQFSDDYELLDMLSAEALPVVPHLAPTIPTIKGHSLGESWEAFVAQSPNLHHRVGECASERRPDPNRRTKRVVFNPCAALWRMADNPYGSITLDCLEPYLNPSKNVVCQDLNGEVSFDDGKLSSLKVVVLDDLAMVLPDTIAKFGKPDARDESGSLRIWDSDTFRAVATQIEIGTAIAWMTRARVQEGMERQKRILETVTVRDGNSLDR